MTRNHTQMIAVVSALFGLALVFDSLETSLSINDSFNQILPDWAWALCFIVPSVSVWFALKRKHHRIVAVCLILLTVLWVSVTVPRLIHFLPSSVLYCAMVAFCARTYFLSDKTTL